MTRSALLETPRFAILPAMPRVLPLLILCAAAHAAEVAQFRAENFGEEWRAARGGAALVAVHPATNGWVAAFADRGGVSFAGTNGVASPMEFNNAPTGAVARVLIVADCTEARPWSALLDAPVGAAFAPRAFEWDLVRFATSNCLGAVSVSVDGVAGAAMPTNGTPHLVEVAFQEPVAADELYLGGHPATPAWDRAWQGRVFEALFCFGDPSATDTDADASGIPDCWEKWTHTRGFAQNADPDGDGLTNLAEFEAQTDPIRSDTDGDGIDDATELAGLAAGVVDLDPLAPATFAADEPDTDEDGIPDLWEDADVPLFYGVDADGFPWDVPVPEEAANNYDVTVSVTSSRHAVLSWGTDDGESILLPPCTNLSLRLRLSADEAKTVGLSPGSATGLWKANLRATWRPRPD